MCPVSQKLVLVYTTTCLRNEPFIQLTLIKHPLRPGIILGVGHPSLSTHGKTGTPASGVTFEVQIPT